MAVGPAREATVYEPVPFWARIPHGVWLREATSVAVDSADRVYVFNRGNVPVLVLDPGGRVVGMWGNDTPFDGPEQIADPYGNPLVRWAGSRFLRPHAITVDHEDALWLVDDIGNTVTRTGRDGTPLFTLGTGRPSGFQSGEPFNRPTDVAVCPASGDIFVTDGYGNSRVHRFAADGTHVRSWGAPGSDPGLFSLPHNLVLLDDGSVAVCDRENHRVQIFGPDGTFRDAWHVHRPAAICRGRGTDSSLYIAEQGPPPVQHGVPGLGHRIGIWTQDGRRITQFGGPLPGEAPDRFNWLHGVAVDSEGSVYAAEVSYTEVGRALSPPRELVSLRKWRRAAG
jgi:DNA-binding beta-propeller fold protein YncE